MGKYKTLQEAANSILNAGRFKAAVTHNGWKKGDWVNIANAYVSGTYVQVVVNSNGAAYNLTLAQIDGCPESRAELKEEVEKLNKQIEIINTKLKYLDSTKQETFDDTEFKVWNTLQVLKGKKNDVDKAKLIANLINS